MTETLANGYSFESAHRELSNEYQHDRVLMVLKNICLLVNWTKVASALEGLKKQHQFTVQYFSGVFLVLALITHHSDHLECEHVNGGLPNQWRCFHRLTPHSY